MSLANKFRIVAIVVAALILAYAPASLYSEIFSTKRPPLPADPSRITAPKLEPSLANTISPLRADLEGNRALSLALTALQPGTGPLSAADVQKNMEGEEAIKEVLRQAPYRSELWLVLATLQTQRKTGNKQIIEALKMSYFTAPNDAQLMPLRLYTAAHSDALADGDLKELARGDVRLMLIRQSDLREAVSSAYFAGSNVGRTFIEEAVQSVDPKLVSLLRK
jgi:hypothetical protein